MKILGEFFLCIIICIGAYLLMCLANYISAIISIKLLAFSIIAIGIIATMFLIKKGDK